MFLLVSKKQNKCMKEVRKLEIINLMQNHGHSEYLKTCLSNTCALRTCLRIRRMSTRDGTLPQSGES